MNTIEQLSDLIPELIERFPAIEVFYLFGSHASGRAGTGSDVDCAVVLNARRYRVNALLDLEVGLFLQEKLGVPVDVVVLNRASAIVQHEVLRTGKRLYEQSARQRAGFELQSFKAYMDVRHYQRKRLEMSCHG